VVLYGCETWSLTLSEEHRLKVFQNKMLRRIFGPKRDEMTRGWGKLHIEELQNLYVWPNINKRRMRRAGHAACTGVNRNGGKARRKETPLRRNRRRWEDNIKLDLRERGWDGMECINLAKDRDHWRVLMTRL
jgi:hypothetical protein